MKHRREECTKCDLHKVRRKIVSGRGDLPAKLLFMGEAPGKREDLMGQPFIGKAGQLLDCLIEDAARLERVPEPPYFIINTVFCHPTDKIAGANREPTPEEILACYPNVMRLVNRVKPMFVIFLGRIAERYYKKEFPESMYMRHPAFILRKGGKRSPLYLSTVRQLSEIFVSLHNKEYTWASD